MKSYHKLFVLLIIIGFGSSSFGQSKTLDGYVVLKTGDTLKGNIKRLQISGTSTLKFTSLDGKMKSKFTADAIKGFKYGDETYVSLAIDSLKITDEFKHGKTIFAKELVKGHTSLYIVNYCYGGKQSAKRENKVYKEYCPIIYYLKRPQQAYVEGYKREKKLQLMNKQKLDKASFAYYFKKCEDVFEQIMLEQLDRKDLKYIVVKYNECVTK